MLNCVNGVCYDGLIPQHVLPSYGVDELGHLMTICNTHISSRTWATIPPTPPDYLDAWKACYKVREQWLKSEAHRKLIEEQEQETRDLKRVEDFVKGLE